MAYMNYQAASKQKCAKFVFHWSFLKPGTERNDGGTFCPVPPTKIRNSHELSSSSVSYFCFPLLFMSMPLGREFREVKVSNHACYHKLGQLPTIHGD